MYLNFIVGITQFFPLFYILFNATDLLKYVLGLAVIVPETFLRGDFLVLSYLGLLGI